MERPKQAKPAPKLAAPPVVATQKGGKENPLKGSYDDFEKSVNDMSSNLYSIAKSVSTGKNADKSIEALPASIQLIQNWLLNLNSRPNLLMGYIKRVYVNRFAFDAGDGDTVINDDEYFYGDFELAKPYAPMFKTLWHKHMNKEEKGTAMEFFRTFNAIVEDWILLGAVDAFGEDRSFDRSILKRLYMSLEAMDKVPEKRLTESQELANHYDLLATIRVECLSMRAKKVGVSTTKSTVSSTTPPQGETRKEVVIATTTKTTKMVVKAAVSEPVAIAAPKQQKKKAVAVAAVNKVATNP